MAKGYGVLEADEPLSAEPRTFLSKNVARYLLRKALAIPVGYKLIQRVKPRESQGFILICSSSRFWDGPMGIGNVLPFSRPTDPGHHSHYEIPMAGDRGPFARHRRKKIKVSARSRGHLPAIKVPTQTLALLLAAAGY
jgi:hypothetical protein